MDIKWNLRRLLYATVKPAVAERASVPIRSIKDIRWNLRRFLY